MGTHGNSMSTAPSEVKKILTLCSSPDWRDWRIGWLYLLGGLAVGRGLRKQDSVSEVQ